MNTSFNEDIKKDPQKNFEHKLYQQTVQNLQDDDIAKIKKYLNDPVSSGLWRFQSTWNPNSAISNYLFDTINQEIDENNKITIVSGKRKKIVNIDTSFMNNATDRIRFNLSFILSIFTYICRIDDENIQPTDIKRTSLFELLLDLVDIEEFKTKFSHAFEYFKNNIYCENFKPSVKTGYGCIVKSGVFIMLSGPKSKYITLVSWNNQPLESTKELLEILGVISKSKLMPLFSPEDEVYSCYFTFLDLVQDKILDQEHLKPLFIKAIQNYKDGKYIDCVSPIGLIAEDLLTQIYETLFRTQLSKGLTLGQLYDEINAKVNSLYTKNQPSAPELNYLYAEVSELLENSSQNKDEKILSLTRKIIKEIIESNKYMNNKIESLGKPQKRNYIFPQTIQHAMNELIKYRNASSHKSRVPIGPYESTRSIHSLITIIFWWEKELELVDWSQDKNEIIKKFVSRNQ